MNNNFKYNKTAFAFSLIEMLLALLVASLLMAALAPVITRRMGENLQISNTGNIKASYDLQCYSYSDTNPSVTVPLQNIYYANFIIASGGGGGAGATSTRKIAANPVQITGTLTSDTSQAINITEYMTDVKIESLVGAGGGGAGGGGYVSGCPEGTVQFAGDSTVKAFCMTKYNVGERENPTGKTEQPYVPIARGVHFYHVNDQTDSISDCSLGGRIPGKCCYFAYGGENTSKQCTTTGYNACTRIVCQYTAAQSSCKGFNYYPANIPSTVYWNLPNNNQLIYLRDSRNNNIISATSLGSGGALLCDGDTSVYGGYQCASTGGCPGTYDGSCFPNVIWSSTPITISGYENQAYHIFLGNGKIGGPGATPITRAFSARCTLDKTNLFRSYSGSGGNGGAMMSNIDVTEWVKKAGIGGKIEITADKAGNGSNGAANKNNAANNGGNGNISRVLIKDKNGNVVYGVRVVGGNGGSSAKTISVNGSAANNTAQSTIGNCQTTTNGNTWVNAACNKNITNGSNGTVQWGSNSSAPYATGGKGGNSNYTSMPSGGGNGGNGSTTDGLNGTTPTSAYPGAGGGGGSAIYGYNDNIVAGRGGNGAGGMVRITYNNELAGAGGGGGGGGSIAQIKNIYMGSKTQCTLTIGKGGNGGSVDNNGMDGESSSVKCDNDARIFSVDGGKGGKRGAAASGINASPINGVKGSFGNANSYIYSLDPEKRVIKKGLDGIDGSYNSTKKYSIGGKGGTSGAGTKGACGGLYAEANICEVSDADIYRINGKGFEYKDIVTPLTNDIQNAANISYGKAGAGGGGGGWTRELGPGKGGDGMNGYVCIYWYNEGH